MHILQVNTDEAGGGASAIARRLHEGLRARGHQSWIAVRVKSSEDPDVLPINNDLYRDRWAQMCIRAARLLNPLRGKFRGPGRLHAWLSLAVASPRRYWNIRSGREDFDYPATPHLLNLTPAFPDILHLHNLHGDFFDLRVLPEFCRRIPVFMTLHDPWLLSGHCAHSFDCERWKTGCGACPGLTFYPEIRNDATAFNWRRKAQIYAASRLYVATPSRWLMNRVAQSMLFPGVQEARVIPNGVDLSVFHPSRKSALRSRLGLSRDSQVVLYVAAGGRSNPFKDFITMRHAAELCAQATSHSNIVFIGLGEDGPVERIGSSEFRYVPYQLNKYEVAAYYQAADVYVHSAKVDTFPSTVLEAMACGTPVVATRVGGVSEQVADGKTGFLVPPADVVAMANAILCLLGDNQLRREMSAQGAELAASQFGLDRMVDSYLDWYHEIIDHNASSYVAATA